MPCMKAAAEDGHVPCSGSFKPRGNIGVLGVELPRPHQVVVDQQQDQSLSRGVAPDAAVAQLCFEHDIFKVCSAGRFETASQKFKRRQQALLGVRIPRGCDVQWIECHHRVVQCTERAFYPDSKPASEALYSG
jgi:hypothetical protein